MRVVHKRTLAKKRLSSVLRAILLEALWKLSASWYDRKFIFAAGASCSIIMMLFIKSAVQPLDVGKPYQDNFFWPSKIKFYHLKIGRFHHPHSEIMCHIHTSICPSSPEALGFGVTAIGLFPRWTVSFETFNRASTIITGSVLIGSA